MGKSECIVKASTYLAREVGADESRERERERERELPRPAIPKATESGVWTPNEGRKQQTRDKRLPEEGQMQYAKGSSATNITKTK